VEGLRVSARDIAYFVDARVGLGGLLGWRDQGLVTLDVGEEGNEGQGLKIDLELELSGDDLDKVDSHSAASTPVFFKVVDVKVDLPGLAFTIKQSRHWFFNSVLLQPLLGPSVRRVLAGLLESQIRAGLEAVEGKLSEARRMALEEGGTDDAEPGWGGLLRAFYRTLTTTTATPQEEEGPPDAVTSTSLTTKGVVLTSHQPATTVDQDTIVAVGIGEQVLVDVPLPHPDLESGGHAKALEDVEPILRQEGREALDELEDGVESTKSRVEEVGETAREARRRVAEEVQVAAGRLGRKDEVERGREGWRSHAFDLM